MGQIVQMGQMGQIVQMGQMGQMGEFVNLNLSQWGRYLGSVQVGLLMCVYLGW